MWEEWQFDIGYNNPAKDFTTNERNGQGTLFKMKYSRCLKVWRVMQYLINHGMMVEATIGMMINVYQENEPTPMIHIITRDQLNPNYPYIGNQRSNPRLIAGKDCRGRLMV